MLPSVHCNLSLDWPVLEWSDANVYIYCFLPVQYLVVFHCRCMIDCITLFRLSWLDNASGMRKLIIWWSKIWISSNLKLTKEGWWRILYLRCNLNFFPSRRHDMGSIWQWLNMYVTIGSFVIYYVVQFEIIFFKLADMTWQVSGISQSWLIKLGCITSLW